MALPSSTTTMSQRSLVIDSNRCRCCDRTMSSSTHMDGGQGQKRDNRTDSWFFILFHMLWRFELHFDKTGVGSLPLARGGMSITMEAMREPSPEFPFVDEGGQRSRTTHSGKQHDLPSRGTSLSRQPLMDKAGQGFGHKRGGHGHDSEGHLMGPLTLNVNKSSLRSERWHLQLLWLILLLLRRDTLGYCQSTVLVSHRSLSERPRSRQPWHSSPQEL